MKRRSRSPVVGRASVPTSTVYISVLKQSQSRAAGLANGTKGLLKLYDDVDGPTKGNNVQVMDTTASYSNDLVNAFKRKTQELCDETREQYEQKFERQEAQHERQVQSMQRQLREVVGSCVSLAEHEQIIHAAVKEKQQQLEGVQRRHRSDLREIEQNWQSRVTAANKQSEQDKAALLQRIEQLELQKSDAAAEAKERELSELRWGETLEAMEERVEDGKNRLEDACRIIVALKTKLRHHARLKRDLEAQREEVMKCKLAYAELKGDMAGLEKELAHEQRAMADEKLNAGTLQSEVGALREQLQRQKCTAVELTTKAELSAEHHAMERMKLEQEVETLHGALQQEKQSATDASVRMEKMQQQVADTQLQHQDLRTRLELLQTAESSWKRKVHRQQQRADQFKKLAEKLHAQNTQLGEEVQQRDASTEAWAKKLFGRR